VTKFSEENIFITKRS